MSVDDEIANAGHPGHRVGLRPPGPERLDRARRRAGRAGGARQAREEELARAPPLAAERRRIAREMHDVVGHGVTLMLLHADAAQAGLGGREPATAQALDVVLTSGPHGARGPAPAAARPPRRQPAGAGDAEPGHDRGRRGLVAAPAGTCPLTVDGRVRPLPAAVEATAYRIVQESLTNALKHAPGARSACAATRSRRWRSRSPTRATGGAVGPAGRASGWPGSASGWPSSTAG